MDKVRNPVIYFFLLTRGLGYIWTVISRFLNLLSTATANTNTICTYSRLNIYIYNIIYILIISWVKGNTMAKLLSYKGDFPNC